jgi:hypothetical protein
VYLPKTAVRLQGLANTPHASQAAVALALTSTRRRRPSPRSSDAVRQPRPHPSEPLRCRSTNDNRQRLQTHRLKSTRRPSGQQSMASEALPACDAVGAALKSQASHQAQMRHASLFLGEMSPMRSGPRPVVVYPPAVACLSLSLQPCTQPTSRYSAALRHRANEQNE